MHLLLIAAAAVFSAVSLDGRNEIRVTARELEIDTAFLKDGDWNAEIFADGANADCVATDYVRTTRAVRAGEKLRVKLAPGGGWTARFEKR